MNPGHYTLQLYRGDSYHWRFTLYDDINQTLPSDLTGVVANAQIRDRPAGNYICMLACVLTLPNLIDMVLTAGNSAGLPNSAAWDLQLTYASGDVATVLAGPVNVTADVTNLYEPLPTPSQPFVRARMSRRA